LPEHPSPEKAPSLDVILNEVKDLSRSGAAETLLSISNSVNQKQGAGQPRGEILRVAQNDRVKEGNEPETGSWGTRGPSTSLGMTEWVETKGGTEISYDDAFVRVVVLPSDEERMIARDTVRLITGKDAS
jgi:hypothetical protein